jgi:CRISPR-associated protein Cmr6
MPIYVNNADGTQERIVIQNGEVRHEEIVEGNDNDFANSGNYYFDATRENGYGSRILEYVFDPTYQDRFEVSVASHSFKLMTTYPGLLVGSGYPHPKLRESNSDFQLGFFFDHTTGVPVIPGSTIKGVLRSYFHHLHNTQEPEARIAALMMLEDAAENPQESKVDFDTFRSWSDEKKEGLFKKWINIEEEIFSGIDPEEGTLLPRNKRDIFYDAFIVKTDDGNGRIFADDYITPHADPLQDPNPIRFLKIRPQVYFCFQFRLSDGLLTASQKETLFKNLLLLGGAGAKTAVGYGQFDDAGACEEMQAGEG